MVAVGILALIALIWVAAGLALIAFPSWWSTLTTTMVSSPGRRFALTQAMILIGLVLVLGTSSLQTVWLWISIGVIAVLKGMFFLGAPETIRVRVMDWWSKIPTWTHRLAGLCMVGLAVLLTIEAVRIIP